MKESKENKNLYEIMLKSLTWEGENETFPCNITLREDGKTYKAHEVSICNQDLLFFCDKGTINYLVDEYSGAAVLSLYNIDESE